MRFLIRAITFWPTSSAVWYGAVYFSSSWLFARHTSAWRWQSSGLYAVIKPFRYGGIFNKKRTLAYIFSAWMWSLILCGSIFFEVLYVPSNAPSHRCEWQFLWGKQPLRAIVGIIPSFVKNGASKLQYAGTICSHALHDEQVYFSLSWKQGQNARKNDAYGWCRVPYANFVLGAKSDQLRVGNGGKSADEHQTTPRPFSFGLPKQLCKSVHLRAKQQRLPCWFPKIIVSEMQQG